MEPKPVQESRIPSYPTRRDVLTGAAALALATLGGQWRVFAATKEGKIVVAPIFEHGEGRGATGCIVSSPPVFLSEEEAMQIVREELAKKGIEIKEGKTLTDTHVPQRRVDDDDNAISNERAHEVDSVVCPAKALALSGLDAKKAVGVKFVSEQSYHSLGGPVSRWTVQGYDFKEVAGYVAGKVKKQSKEPIYLGIFYDPVTELPEAPREYDSGRPFALETPYEKCKAESQRLLRLQVQDFAAWLKKQKVIEEPKAKK